MRANQRKDREMNLTYDGDSFVCPEGSDEWQNGYRDAMHHYTRPGRRMFFDWDDALGDYASGYMQATRDIMDHTQELNAQPPAIDRWELVQQDAATYVVELEGKRVEYIRYNGAGKGSWQVMELGGLRTFPTPEQAFAHIVYTFR